MKRPPADEIPCRVSVFETGDRFYGTKLHNGGAHEWVLADGIWYCRHCRITERVEPPASNALDRNPS